MRKYVLLERFYRFVFFRVRISDARQSVGITRRRKYPARLFDITFIEKGIAGTVQRRFLSGRERGDGSIGNFNKPCVSLFFRYPFFSCYHTRTNLITIGLSDYDYIVPRFYEKSRNFLAERIKVDDRAAVGAHIRAGKISDCIGHFVFFGPVYDNRSAAFAHTFFGGIFY